MEGRVACIAEAGSFDYELLVFEQVGIKLTANAWSALYCKTQILWILSACKR